MSIRAEIDTDLIVQSFAYMAKQVVRNSSALSATAQYEQVLNEAEKHRSALRLAESDAAEFAWQSRRDRQLAAAKNESPFAQDRAMQRIANAQQAITRIASQYAPQRMAA